MNKIINLYNVTTYPFELIKIFNEKYESNNNDYYISLIKDYEVLCLHTTRVYDINTIKQYGLLRPFIFNSEDDCVISPFFKEILFNPFTKILNNEDIIKLKEQYDLSLINEYEEEKHNNIKGWYGKYSNICFTFEPIDRVINNTTGYTNFLENYGGELLSQKTSDLVYNITRPYLLNFKILISELDNKLCSLIIDFMYAKWKGQSFKAFLDGSINKDIPPRDIINIKEVK